MKKLLFVIIAAVAVLSLNAENNPIKSDVFWVTVPDSPDWLYKTGQKARVEVQVYKYGMPLDGVEVAYSLGQDMLPSDAEGRVTLKAGKAVIDMGTMKKPGFRDCRMTATVDGKRYTHHVKVGFSPEKIEPYTKMPDDFNKFWSDAKAEAAQFPLKYTKEPAPEYSSDKVDCFLVKLQLNQQGQSVYGYLFIPKGAQKGSSPVVFCPPGAGIKTLDPSRRIFYADKGGFVRFEIEIHGLNPKIERKYFDEISKAFNGRENGYLANGLDNRDNYYMKRVYLACVRSLDFLTSLPEWDGRNVVVQGGSQGGALALVTAGLDSRVTACMANHPALSDMAGYMNGTGGYPHFFATKGMDTPDKLNTMAYYDVVNFARNIKAPVYMTWGYNDDTCPPTTSYAVYNVITSPKEALLTPINEHWTSDDTEYAQMLWAKKQFGRFLTQGAK